MKKLISILFAFSCLQSTSAQSHNRRVMIDMILSNSRHTFKTNKDQKTPFYIPMESASSHGCFPRVEAIPHYCLARGAVICRLEEYVQLHSPFKLNIGVGGE
jgi:hypothetical protein